MCAAKCYYITSDGFGKNLARNRSCHLPIADDINKGNRQQQCNENPPHKRTCPEMRKIPS